MYILMALSIRRQATAQCLEQWTYTLRLSKCLGFGARTGFLQEKGQPGCHCLAWLQLPFWLPAPSAISLRFLEAFCLCAFGRRLRFDSSFAWGLRLLCLVDGFFLYGSLLLPICPSRLRALTLALLWGPPLSYAAVSTLAPRPLVLAMCYHVVACAAPLAMAWPRAAATNGAGPAANDAGGTSDGSATASGGDGTGFVCAAGWLLLPPLFHAWALSLLVRFHACLAALAPREKQLLRRFFLLR
jgi:hypothetical protein